MTTRRSTRLSRARAVQPSERLPLRSDTTPRFALNSRGVSNEPGISIMIKTVLPVAFAVIALPLAAGASVVGVGNLGNTNESSFSIGDTYTDIADAPLANAFTTGSGSEWELISITLSLGEIGDPAGDLMVSLFDNNGGVPGMEIVGFGTNNPSGEALANYRFTPDSQTILSPDETFWIVTSAPYTFDDQYIWAYSFDGSEAGLAGWLIGDTSFAEFPQGTWEALDLASSNVPTQFQVEVRGAVVPLPATLWLMIGGVGILGAVARRRST